MRKKSASRAFAPEALEPRLCLASSVGWDGAGLGTAALTYTISGAPSSLGDAATKAAIETALAAWTSVAQVTFTEASATGLARSIDFSFRSIDGAGGTLAVGYYPNDLNRDPIAGDVIFDSAESWEVGNGKGSAAFDMVLTAVHEIGHALGLDHSSDQASILAPTVSPDDAFTGLAASDVAAIRSLYATRNVTETVVPVATPASATTTPTSPTTTTTVRRYPTFTFLPRFRWSRQIARLATREMRAA